jgi:hypothetical protein
MTGTKQGELKVNHNTITKIWGCTVDREPTDTAQYIHTIARLKDENAALTDLVAKLRKSLEISDNMMLDAMDKLEEIYREKGR